MNKNIKVILAVSIAAAIGASSALAQPLISVDEWGNGTIGGSPLPWQTSLVEPFSGMTTLSYNLPFLGNRGDVVIADSDGTVSDIIRFDGNSHLFFFSDLPPAISLADVGIPGPVAAAPALFFNEVIVGGAEGYFGYLPVGNDPGGTTAPVMYDFISSYIPEPSLPALLACGFGILTLGRRRR